MRASAPIAPASQLRGVERGHNLGEHGIDRVLDVPHHDDRSDGDDRRQKRVLDQVLARILTNETNEHILHFYSPYAGLLFERFDDSNCSHRSKWQESCQLTVQGLSAGVLF